MDGEFLFLFLYCILFYLWVRIDYIPYLGILEGESRKGTRACWLLCCRSRTLEHGPRKREKVSYLPYLR